MKVMLNVKLLKIILLEKDVSMNELADLLNINITTLYRKVNGNSDFYRNEIECVKRKLHLSNEQINSIFFT